MYPKHLYITNIIMLELIAFTQADPHQPLVDFYQPQFTNKATYYIAYLASVAPSTYFKSN